MIPAEIKKFFNDKGQLKQLEKEGQAAGTGIPVGKLEKGRIYTEKEVNEMLNEAHIFNDAPLLRRELYDNGFIDRTRDCRQYWKSE